MLLIIAVCNLVHYSLQRKRKNVQYVYNSPIVCFCIEQKRVLTKAKCIISELVRIKTETVTLENKSNIFMSESHCYKTVKATHSKGNVFFQLFYNEYN